MSAEPNHDRSGSITDDSKTNILSMLLLTISMFLYNTNSTMVKYMNLSVIQMLWFRSLIAFIMGLFLWTFQKPASHINEPWYVCKEKRNIAWILGLACNFTSIFLWIGIHYVPVGDTECIFFLGPLFISIIGHYYLKDALSNTFIFTFIGTIISIFILTQPAFIFKNVDSAETLNPIGILSLLFSTFNYITSAILTRKINQVHAIQILIIETFQGSFILLPAFFIFDLCINNKNFELQNDWILYIILLGIGIGISHVVANLSWYKAYQMGNSTKIVWFEYVAVAFAYIYQSYLFHDIPNLWEIIGAIGVIICAFLPLFEELFVYVVNSRKHQYIVVAYESEEVNADIDFVL
eukprot:297949_1